MKKDAIISIVVIALIVGTAIIVKVNEKPEKVTSADSSIPIIWPRESNTDNAKVDKAFPLKDVVDRSGERITYYSNGNIFRIESKPDLEGIHKVEQYYANGSLESIGFFKNGLRYGNFTFFNDGIKDKVFVYQDGVLTKSFDYYKNGHLRQQTLYLDTRHDRIIVEEYYPSGSIKKKATMVRSIEDDDEAYIPVGDIYVYDEKGRVSISQGYPDLINKESQPFTPTTSSTAQQHIAYRSILRANPLSNNKMNSYTGHNSREVKRQSSTWDRGYSYGWDVGYQDAIDANGAWASYDDSGKGGDFLEGYTAGYIDGYENGMNDRDEDDEEIEDL